MWNVPIITSVFVISHVGSIRSEFFNVSARIAVVVGKSAELSCKRDDINDVKYWDHYTLSKINGSWSWNNARIYNGVDIREEFKSSMNWTRNARGKWILHITLVNMSNSGYYKCGRSEQLNNSSISLTEVVLELIVLASDPQCNVSQEVLKEGEYIELWCSLKYFGSIPPVMKWSKSGIDPEAAINNGSIYNVTLNEVMSQLYVKADSSLHNSKYICNCYFESSCYQAGLLECAAPDYEFTWISPILLVEYQSKYIDINPVKEFFYPGETVICSADGYPTPDYKWNNLEGRTSKTHNGPILAITKEMVRDTEYVYECSASNSKDDNGIRRSITITVKAPIPVLTAITISIGILSTLLLVAILIVKLGMRRGIGNRQPDDKYADVVTESVVTQNIEGLSDDCVRVISNEGVWPSNESNEYDEIRPFVVSGNQGELDQTSPSGHSDGSYMYMELLERHPAIPPVYTSLEEVVE